MVATAERFYGAWYTHYRHHEGFAKRARLFANFPGPILVVGAAFGYLVEELLQYREAYGIDASEWAVEHAEGRVIVADVLADVEHVRGRLGAFASVITEDLLPSLTDDEAVTASINCAQLGSIVVHLVTERGNVAELNYHSTAEWMTLIQQLTVSLGGM